MVKSGNSISSECELKTGVPQGGCLRPILFIIYAQPRKLHEKL